MNEANLQRAIYAKLTNDAALMALIKGVYADVQQPNLPEDGASFPYVVIGQDTITSWDTKTDDGGNALCQIDVWSRQNNLLQAKDVGGAVYNALHQTSLSITGAEHVLTTVETATYSKDPDGHTKRGMVMVRVLYDEI